MIFADSPEAKGRIERTFRTIQDRLIPELRLNKITELGAANEYLLKEFLGKYWKSKNTVKAENPEMAYSPADPWVSLEDVLCVEEYRKIGSDQTVSWRSEKFVVDGGSMSLAGHLAIFRTSLDKKTRVLVHEREVELKGAEEVSRRPLKLDSKQILEIDSLLYIKMYKTILELNNSVKTFRVMGGKLKLPKRAS